MNQKNTTRKIIIFCVIFVATVSGVVFGLYSTKLYDFFLQNNQQIQEYPNTHEEIQKESVVQNEVKKETKEVTQEIKPQPALPVRLQVPAIGVSSNIEVVGLDSLGRMDVPKNAQNVAWYQYGVKPGEVGNAVIAGHLDTRTGAPAVFFNLEDLKAGDEIIVTDENGKQYTYRVTHTAVYPFSQFPLQEVFGATDKSNLNLITCEGTFDRASRNYSHRVVIYSELV